MALVIEGYTITEVYPHIAYGLNAKGQRKCFQTSYLLLNSEQRAEQDEYWAGVEAEFHRRHDVMDFSSNIRRHR